MYRICHVTSHDHSFEASCDCLCGAPLVSLATIGTVIAEICF